MSLWDSLRSLVEDGSVAWGFIVAVAIVLLLTPVTWNPASANTIASGRPA